MHGADEEVGRRGQRHLLEEEARRVEVVQARLEHERLHVQQHERQAPARHVDAVLAVQADVRVCRVLESEERECGVVEGVAPRPEEVRDGGHGCGGDEGW